MKCIDTTTHSNYTFLHFKLLCIFVDIRTSDVNISLNLFDKRNRAAQSENINLICFDTCRELFLQEIKMRSDRNLLPKLSWSTFRIMLDRLIQICYVSIGQGIITRHIDKISCIIHNSYAKF